DLSVYISETEQFADFANATGSLVWRGDHILLGDWSEERMTSMNLTTSEHVKHNGTLYAHIYLTKHGSAHISNGTVDAAYKGDDYVYQRKLLTRYLPKRRVAKKRSLVGANTSEDHQEKGNNGETVVNEEESDVKKSEQAQEIISYWYQNLTVNILTEANPLHLGAMSERMRTHIHMERTGRRDTTGAMPFHLPALYQNDFWALDEYLMPINDTVSTLPLNIIFYPISLLKFQLYTQMDDSFSQQEKLMGISRSEIDQLKRTLLETNPYILAFTAIVSILHSVFDFLAFKNDIAFWKERKDDVAGLSVRTIGLNILFQLIILLYLFDNEANTSWMILISQAIGLAIECWKVKKAVDVKVYRMDGAIPWRISFRDKASYSESKTKEYDALAFRYLSWAAYPLLVGYAIYSLIYDEHRGWYSYVINTLVGFVYTFGFISMTPQLFINYKLKSVAHMPWRTFMYKALNTFVDDLFAFWIIRMPMLHRLACLPHVVFFVYLYQRWIYPVDHTRANEFGQVG
ncbi:cleft lip and palate transmembrane protein 1-domain-containing protein, partial [Thamnocephalis sphaerospora]